MPSYCYGVIWLYGSGPFIDETMIGAFTYNQKTRQEMYDYVISKVETDNLAERTEAE